MDAGILDVIENAMEDQRQEDAVASQNFVKVAPVQMRLLRKMSAIGLDPSDFEPYEAKQKTGDEALNPRALMVLGACGALLLFAPEAGVVYCSFLPLILFAVALMVSLPREFAERKEEMKQEQDDDMFSITSAVRSRRRGHLHGHARHLAHEDAYLGEGSDSPGARSVLSHASHQSRKHSHYHENMGDGSPADSPGAHSVRSSRKEKKSRSSRHLGDDKARKDGTPRRKQLNAGSGTLDAASGSLGEDSYSQTL